MEGKVGSQGGGKGLPGIEVISKQAIMVSYRYQIRSVHNKGRSATEAADDVIDRLPLTLFVGAKRVTAVAPLVTAERRGVIETALASAVRL